MCINVQREILSNDTRASEYDDTSSFLSKLREGGVWSYQAYWRFELALFASAEHETLLTAPRLFRSVFHTYAQVLMMISAHLDELDGYMICNLNREQLHECKERFMLITADLIEGRLPKNHCTGVANPYLP